MSDLDSWRKLKSESGEFLEEMMEYQREQFNSWTRENLHDVEGKHLSLQTTSQVVYFEAGKDMKVQSIGYDSRRGFFHNLVLYYCYLHSIYVL